MVNFTDVVVVGSLDLESMAYTTLLKYARAIEGALTWDLWSHVGIDFALSALLEVRSSGEGTIYGRDLNPHVSFAHSIMTCISVKQENSEF